MSRPQTSARANVLARRMDGNGWYFSPWFPAWVPPRLIPILPHRTGNYASEFETASLRRP